MTLIPHFLIEIDPPVFYHKKKGTDLDSKKITFCIGNNMHFRQIITGVFQVSASKKLGMVGRSYFFCYFMLIFYMYFFIFLSFSQFMKCFELEQRDGKPETCIYIFVWLYSTFLVPCIHYDVANLNQYWKAGGFT